MGDEARARERLEAERDEILLVRLADRWARSWKEVRRIAPVYVLLISVSFGWVRVGGAGSEGTPPCARPLRNVGLHASSDP